MWYILNNLPLVLWFVCFFFKLISPSFPSLIALSHWWRTLLLFCSSFWVSWSMRVSKQLQNTGHTFFFCGWMWRQEDDFMYSSFYRLEMRHCSPFSLLSFSYIWRSHGLMIHNNEISLLVRTFKSWLPGLNLIGDVH